MRTPVPTPVSSPTSPLAPRIRVAFAGLLFALFFAPLLTSTSALATSFDYAVYSGTWTSLPNFAALTPTASGTSATITRSVTAQAGNFGLVFTNTLHVSTAGTYFFSTRSDAGSKLWVDGVVVVDNDGLHAPTTVEGSRVLAVGNHSLRVEYFAAASGATLEVGYRTGIPATDPIPADGQLDFMSSNPASIGSWGPIIAWPEIAISAAMLPDGRVLTWSSTETGAFPFDTEFTHASVFDPATSTFINVDNNFHDMFCAGLATLENGTIIAAGGNPSDRRATAFNPSTLSWTPLPDMIYSRWYGLSTTMPNNTVWQSFARDAGTRTEVYDPRTNSWSRRLNADVEDQNQEQQDINGALDPNGWIEMGWVSQLAVTPQGDVFQGGPTQTWHRYDPMGGASIVSLGRPIGDVARNYGNVVTYDEGKVMLLGGADPRLATPTSRNNVYRVDLTGPSPVVTPGPPMRYARALSNTVTLANGELIVIGGTSLPKFFDDNGTIWHTEIYSPSTNSWRTTAAIDVPRNYHSTALLMKDGRVISMGGGGRANGDPANHLDGQIYSPPYLFESDGSPAIRPTLSIAGSKQFEAGQSVVVTASATTTRFSLVRLSAETHHVNTDQRFLPVSSVANGNGTFTLQLPANPNTLIVGNYFLFALDADGTPSIGETVQIVRDVQAVLDPSAVYLSDLPWASEVNGVGPAERDHNNGDEGPTDGGPIRIGGVVHEKGIGVHAFSEITIALGGQYDRFITDLALDDSQDGDCGEVQFEVLVDGVVQYSTGLMDYASPNEHVDLPVGTANSLLLRVNPLGSTCGDRGDWASARLIPKATPGHRYYRFRSTRLRGVSTPNGSQLAELALLRQGVRKQALVVSNPGGNNPAGQGPAHADDANVATIWHDYNRGLLVYEMGSRVEIDAYTITTASDVPDSDPVRWSFEASDDGVHWQVLDDRTGQDQATPLARGATSPVFTIGELPPVTPLPFAPRHSTTLIVEASSGADRLWNVNPDEDTVTVSTPAGVVLAEIPVADRPWSIARRPGQARVYVVNKGSASISVIDAASLSVVQTIPLPRASEPHGLVFSADGGTYWVVLEASARLEKRSATSNAVLASLSLGGRPRHLSITNDDAKLLVSNFITPPVPGESTLSVTVASAAAQVFAVDAQAMTLSQTIGLPWDGRSQSEAQGPGLPNYLGPAVVDFAGLRAYVPSKKDNIRAGALRGVPGMSFDSTVRANTSRILLASGTEDPSFRIDLDNASLATDAALSGDGRYLFVTLETSRELAVVDLDTSLPVMRVATGRAPQSVALSSDGHAAYVHDFMDRQISRFDLTALLQTHDPVVQTLTPIPVVATEALPPTLLLGKQLFYDAADPRIAKDRYLSCASCHADGDGDGRVWDLGAFGEGLRNTIDLRGKGVGHGRPHWTGNFDEIQDFEGQIRALNHGTGLLTAQQFATTSDPLGPPKAGLSADLDALAAYVASLTNEPPSPQRPNANTLGASAVTGRDAFYTQGCLGCHALPKLTDSPALLRHDVGTIHAGSGQRLGGPLDGFDTPGLIGVWSSPPYLHDGSAATLEDAIAAHSSFAALPAPTRTAIADFLREAESADLAVFGDGDGDGVVDLVDPAPFDPCVPSTFAGVCNADTDGDGIPDHLEGPTADADGDGLFDYQESSTADADGDGVADQADPANANACIPNASAPACVPPAQVPTAPPAAQILLVALMIATGFATLRGRRAR